MDTEGFKDMERGGGGGGGKVMSVAAWPNILLPNPSSFRPTILRDVHD